jgi:IS1 family transposase/transposase-like protein
MIGIAVRCPSCQSEQIVQRGKTRRGTQRYLYHNTACIPQSFLLEYRYQGRVPEVKQQSMARSLNARGVRETARVLHSSPDPVLRALRQQEAALASVNTPRLRTLDADEIRVDMPQAGAAETDEMWGFVGTKGNQRWLWHAIEHHTGAVWASVFGRRKDAVFVQRKALLEPCGITRSCTGRLGAYERPVEAEQHTVGKAHTQKMARTHLTLRMRIPR